MMHRLILCMAAAGIITGIPVQAAVDGMEAARSSTGIALRWENIQGAPYWVAGAAPSRSMKRNWHAIELRGEQGAAIHLPAHALLRVIAEQDGPQEAPVFSISDGTGLAVVHQPIPGADGRSWLIRSDTARPVIVHVQRAEGSATAQRVALFIGHVDGPSDTVTYRHDIPLDGERVRVRQANEALAHSYVRIPAEQEFDITVRGPDRLLLEYRQEHGPAAPQIAATAIVSMSAMLGDQPARLIHQVTGPETAVPVQVDGKWYPASKAERVALDIPSGEHRLRLRTSHRVLLRAAFEGKPDFLLPQINVPDAWRDMRSNTMLEELEQKSIAAGMSNQWRDIGTLAAKQLQREASRLPGQHALQSAADELHRALTQYRDLLPVDAAEVQARSVLMQFPQAPDEAPRTTIAGAEPVPVPAPVALFHTVDDKAIRFALPNVSHPLRIRALVPRDAGAARIEIRYDNGTSATLTAGIPALPDEQLRPDAAVPVTMHKDAWPSMLDGPADRAGAVAVQTRVATTEWEIPPNVKSITLRATAGTVPVALQWAGSTGYLADDQLLAQLTQQRSGINVSDVLLQAALPPLERRLAAAYAQFVANVAPPAKATDRASRSAQADERAAQAAAAAQQESDTASAAALWQQAMQSSDTAVQEQALRGIVSAMLAVGDRFAAERMLRSHWIGDNPALAAAAAQELDALYAREGDRSMQVLFAAARAAKDKSSYLRLSKALTADGDDEMALLAGLFAQERDLPALLQSALRSRKWMTFDALMQQVDAPQERAFWQAQRALSFGELDLADRNFAESSAQPWRKALTEGRTIAVGLHGDGQKQQEAVQSWLQWQATHPGDRVWQDQPDALIRHDGGVSMRSIALDSRTAWWRATTAQPAVARVVGPVRIRIEARPLHGNGDALLSGWLRVKTSDQLWVQPFHQNQPAPGLEIDAQQTRPGMAVVRDIDLPAGLHELTVDAGAVPVAVRLQVERPALQLPVLPAPVAAHFTPHIGESARLDNASACGHLSSCQLVADGTLNAYRIKYEPVEWRGLPEPERKSDPVAARLAADDIDGALAAATDPKERMRLLLWLAETRPSERTRALALGGALAKAHPEPEIRAQWNQLSAGSGWTTLSLVDRSAGLRRVEASQGEPQSPSARIRAALLPALAPGEVRIGAGTRATAVSSDRSSGSLTVELTAEDMPGNATLPLNATIERNGQAVRSAQLQPQDGTVKIPVSLRAGEQSVSVSLQQPYTNQSLRVRFTGARQPEQRVTRDWHIATKAQPVQATVSGPAWIRIDRLDKDGVRSEERLLTDAVSPLVLHAQPGDAESLYRIHQMRVHPGMANASAAALSRPVDYTPPPFAEAPAEWQAASEPVPQRVRFIDTEPLEGQRDSTLTARMSFQRRRDIEASGGGDPIPERFAEAGLSWRKRDEAQARSLFADVLVRDREYGNPVIGFKLRAEQDVQWLTAFPWPFTINASLSGFAQDVSEKQGTSLLFNASVSQTQRLTSTLSHKPSIAFRAQVMNLDTVRDQRLVDTDVFSPYRAEHKRALTFSDTLSWRPWRDTHLAAGISATTNPDFDLGSIDHHQAAIQWRQLVGPVAIEAGVRATRYWADDDRSRGATRRELIFGATGDWWLSAGTRVEVAAELRRDVDTSSTWGGIAFRWHWGPGRQLRDFSQSELDFRGIRGWFQPAPSNQIEKE